MLGHWINWSDITIIKVPSLSDRLITWSSMIVWALAGVPLWLIMVFGKPYGRVISHPELNSLAGKRVGECFRRLWTFLNGPKFQHELFRMRPLRGIRCPCYIRMPISCTNLEPLPLRWPRSIVHIPLACRMYWQGQTPAWYQLSGKLHYHYVGMLECSKQIYFQQARQKA